MVNVHKGGQNVFTLTDVTCGTGCIAVWVRKLSKPIILDQLAALLMEEPADMGLPVDSLDKLDETSRVSDKFRILCGGPARYQQLHYTRKCPVISPIAIYFEQLQFILS